MNKLFILLMLGLVIAGGCTAPDLPRYNPKFVTEQGAADVVRFRNIYCAVAEKAGYSREEVQKQVLLPARTSMLPLTAEELAAPFGPTAVFAQRFGMIYPSYFYENGLAFPPNPVADSRAVFEAKGPATIIIIPGFFGEFVECRPFEELLRNKDSTFFKAWNPGLAAVKDKAFSLNALHEVEYRLDELVMVASYDDFRTHEPLVNLILLYPMAGTLETMGDITEAAEVYMRRLDKAFEVIPAERTKNLFLLGYSQGAPVALELLVKARAGGAQHPWAERIKGMISLAGVIYGSGLADQAIEDQDSAEHKLIQVLGRIAESLEVEEDSDDAAERSAKKARNTFLWTEALAELAAIQINRPPAPPGLQSEVDNADELSLGYLFKTMKLMLFDMFDLGDPDQYFDNVRRYKLVMSGAVAGTEGLSTPARLEWWRNNTVPADVKFFSIAGTMADTARDGAPDLAFFESPYFGGETADYPGLRQSFYGLYLKSGVELNDSQVTVPKACFWPELSRHLNPSQAPFKAHFMGVLGTHHWGVALPRVAQSRLNKLNHFPRAVLLEAMATFMLEKTE